jgi:hypothetical protein
VDVEPKVVVLPIQVSGVPVITAGIGFTDTLAVCLQPVSSIVYVIIALPAALPATVPPALTCAIPMLLLLHIPPEGVELNVMVVA